MTDSNQKGSTSDTQYVEDDHAETVFGYGDGKGPVAHAFVWLVWIGFVIGMAAYLYLYYFPDLAEWQAW